MRRVVCTVLVLGSVLVTAACGAKPDLEPDRAHALQQSVLGVTRAAAQARWDDAEALLATTRTELDAGADRGEVSTARYRQIDSALDQVQTELAAEQARAAAAQQAAAEQAAAAAAAAEQAQAEAAAEQSPSPTVAPSPAAPRPPAAPPKGKDKHPGKGKPGG